MRSDRLIVFLFWLSSAAACWAEVQVRYDAGPGAGPPPVSPSNYVFNATSWTPSIVAATGITNSPVTNDLASGFNAWNTSDNTGASGSVNFSCPVTNTIDALADIVGWSLRARVRVASSFGGGSESCFVEYGTGPSNPRFLIFFGLDLVGNLTAQVQGLGTFPLTTNGQGAASYHLHEVIGNPDGSAKYYVDGNLVASNWNGFVAATSVDGVKFGTGSTAGKGSVNYNLVEWEVLTSKPSVTTLAVTNLATYIATLSANLNLSNAPATAWFEWGATTNYGNTTSGISFGALSNTFNFYQSLTGLSASNTYHFRCAASNALGISFGQDASFATPMLFTATTLAATNLEPRRATLSGAVQPGGLFVTIWFEWGTTTNYGNKTSPGSASATTNIINNSTTITGLATNTTYHYRCAASNVQDLVFGQDVAFTTPPVFIVTSLLNSGTASLRDSIANAIAGDTITFGITGTVTLTSELLISKNLKIIGPGPSLIAVSGNNATRVFTITNGVTVSMSGLRIRSGRTADGADSVSTNNPGGDGISGGGIFNRGTLTLSNCVITANVSGTGGDGFAHGGNMSFDPSVGGDGGDGGGIYNVGNLTLTACTVSGNASGVGGVGGNGADVGPGHPTPADGADGGSGGNGGGIYNSGTATVTASTLSGNSSGTGGTGGGGGGRSGVGAAGGRGRNGGRGSAIYNVGTLSMVGSTVSGHITGRGGNGGAGGAGSSVGGPGGDGGNGGSGAIYSSGSFGLVASTISSNSAGTGGTGGNASFGGPGGNGGNGGDAGGVTNTGPAAVGSLRNTLVAMNTTGLGGAGGPPGGTSGSSGFGPDLKGTFTSEGHNLVGKNDGNASFTLAPGATGDQIGSIVFPINPLLGSLANRGGPTFTMSLLPGSPARDAGDDLLAGLLTADQRGYARLSGTHVDIGAFEVQVVTTNNRPVLVNPLKPGNGKFQFGFTNVPGAEFTVLMSTNVSLPLSNWTVVGGVVEVSPGQFQFTDSTSAGAVNRFYLILWP